MLWILQSFRFDALCSFMGGAFHYKTLTPLYLPSARWIKLSSTWIHFATQVYCRSSWSNWGFPSRHSGCCNLQSLLQFPAATFLDLMTPDIKLPVIYILRRESILSGSGQRSARQRSKQPKGNQSQRFGFACLVLLWVSLVSHMLFLLPAPVCQPPPCCRDSSSVLVKTATTDPKTKQDQDQNKTL